VKTKLLFALGLAVALLSVFCLIWKPPFMWLLAPQALSVMFIRQAQGGYDSLGAPGFPDLAVAFFYPLFVYWLLARAATRGKLERARSRIALQHGAFILFAFLMLAFRDEVW
jgi:hypothetical protein